MRLIIDASLATSCGEKGERGKRCQNFLIVMLDKTNYHVVITKEIGEEWDNHSHKIARDWRKSMNARRRVSRPNVMEDRDLRGKIERVVPMEKALVEMEKDYHLIEAARVTDRRIISLDNAARRYFGTASVTVGELRDIIWVNPTNDEEKADIWLSSGVPTESRRQLRSFSASFDGVSEKSP